MELLTSIISGILAIATSVNAVGDEVLKNKLESQIKSVDTMAVRIDNAPNHDISKGKVQRVRVATRDLEISQAIAFKTLEVDVDGIDIRLKEWLQQDILTEIDGVPTLRLRQLFEQPVNIASRAVLTQEQLDNMLQSPFINRTIRRRLQQTLNRIAEYNYRRKDFEISSLALDLIGENRIALRMKLSGFDRKDGRKDEELDVNFEFALEVIDGASFRLTEQRVFVDGEEVEPEQGVLVVAPVTLKALEEVGIQVRVIEWESDKDELELALFIRANEFAASALLDARGLIEASELFLD
ncbi:hypothetical protein C7B62_10745 [Pleurocapsa sp. CCALA 161]|uniref:LmeA family phospholipid-binding protein n=1 Tax=Pleurocapsa sp. CCALA 161 TaxID=2107688 RepID=UPI000D06636E|nr:DUF2993 domain-containing protein [Pleurocapsa sp. CCALA 161]PSB10081.1 hypothetical protein C7B62_10745 [Pleurocapsa sp. CCALA 161]